MQVDIDFLYKSYNLKSPLCLYLHTVYCNTAEFKQKCRSFTFLPDMKEILKSTQKSCQ